MVRRRIGTRDSESRRRRITFKPFMFTLIAAGVLSEGAAAKHKEQTLLCDGISETISRSVK